MPNVREDPGAASLLSSVTDVAELGFTEIKTREFIRLADSLDELPR